MALDLGKQMGPLPLGAWIVVVGAGLGIALYTRRNTPAPEVVESGNGESGVGVGGSGWTQTGPTGGGSAQPAAPTTNEQWGVKAINWLIAQGYPSNVADSAVRKYLSADKLSPQEYTLIGIVLVAIGAPPQVLPPGQEEPPVTTPPVTTPPVTTPPVVTPPLPTRVFWLQGTARWALAGGPGKWTETTSQTIANTWAAAYEADLNADPLSQAQWNAEKAKYQK